MATDDHEVYERLARIEEQLDAHKETTGKRFHSVSRRHDERFEKVDEIIEKLDTIEKEFSRYRGFVGGVLLVATAIVSALKLFGGNIKDWILGQ